ncbi:MAG TPA: roadblock/LC7 domain-containing protein [Methylomirabilota bacterium]|nr:roadblock/LC7 domain-containing protein [Methylomirabilota bacterium]
MNVVFSTMKFAGLFRGWLRRTDDATEKSAPPQSAVVPAYTPAAPIVSPAPRPQPVPTAPPVSAPAQISNEVEMPLQPILEKLPQDLRAKMTMRIEELGEASIAISMEQILPQLALGSVRITFGQLRGAAPELFRVAEEYDSLPVALPLSVLLSKLNPNLLPRNPAQKSLDVPSEIKGPFGAHAEGVSFATSMMKGPPVSTPPVRMSPPPESPTKIQARMVAQPAPAFTRPVAAPATPVAPAPPRQEVPAAPVAPPTPARPIAPAPMPPAPAPIATPVAPADSMAPAILDSTTVSAPLADLSEKWPEQLRTEFRQLNLMNASVALPMNLVEPALKRGRIIFSWHNLRSWIKPAPGVSANDGLELELPPKVVVPLFLQRHKVRPQLRISVDRSIPNLFFGFPSAEMEAPVAAPLAEAPPPEPAPMIQRPPQAAPSLRAVLPAQPAPPVQPVPVPQPFQPTTQAADTNFFVPAETLQAPSVDQSVYSRPIISDTELKKRLASPKEIVERAMTIPGVAGAVITLPDGLKVAAQVPPELNPDTVAAFIPQIFDRVGQSTRELRMGALNNLRFTVGNVPWKIFRINAVYFAAFGRPGERLPTPELAQLAAELDRKTK